MAQGGGHHRPQRRRYRHRAVQRNDNKADNRFLESLGRFPKIVEDEPPVRLLFNEYPPAR
jgi:hypothetical protein